MIQVKYFTGTIAEVEAAMNTWLAAVATNTQLTFSPLVLVPGTDQVIKEVLINMPARSANGVPTPKLAVPRPGF